MSFEFGNGADRRKKRLKGILAAIESSDGITRRDLVGFCVVHIGLNRKTAERYIKDLFDFGMIYKRGEKYYVRKQS